MRRWVDDIAPRLGRALAGWRDDLADAAAGLTALRGLPAAAAPRMRAYPLAGAVIGLLGGVVFALARWLGLPPDPAALLALATLTLLAGAALEQGLAAIVGALGERADRYGRLDRMHDSRPGAGGVAAIVLTLLARMTAIAALYYPWPALAALVAAGAVSAAMVPLLVAWLPDARSNLVPPPGRADLLVALGLAALVALLALGFWRGLLALAVGLLAAGLIGMAARRAVGGHDPAVRRTVRLVAETAILLAVAAAA